MKIHLNHCSKLKNFSYSETYIMCMSVCMRKEGTVGGIMLEEYVSEFSNFRGVNNMKWIGNVPK